MKNLAKSFVDQVFDDLFGTGHSKGARKSTRDKHTKPRAGDSTAFKPNFERSSGGKAAVKSRHNGKKR